MIFFQFTPHSTKNIASLKLLQATYLRPFFVFEHGALPRIPWSMMMYVISWHWFIFSLQIFRSSPPFNHRSPRIKHALASCRKSPKLEILWSSWLYGANRRFPQEPWPFTQSHSLLMPQGMITLMVLLLNCLIFKFFHRVSIKVVVAQKEPVLLGKFIFWSYFVLFFRSAWLNVVFQRKTYCALTQNSNNFYCIIFMCGWICIFFWFISLNYHHHHKV